LSLIRSNIRRAALALGLALCAGCANQPASVPTAVPSPLVAAQASQPAPGAQPPAVPQPTATPPYFGAQVAPPTAIPASQPLANPSVYFWPRYLPPNMRPAPNESRVASDNEVGANGLGFFIVTLNASGQKLVVGGGDIQDVLPLAGAEQKITAGARSGTLITNGEQRQIVFDVPKGKLFVYSQGLSEQELMRVAESLQPIAVEDLRARAGLS
jgi:hypothetical protein